MKEALRGIDTVLVASQAITDGATVSASWDTIGADHATIRINLSIEETTHDTGGTISLLECDTTVVTDHATFNSSFERSSEDCTAAKEVRYEVDLKARKRYLRLTFTAGTTSGGNMVVGAVGTLTRNAEDPESTTEMGDDVVVIG